MNIKVLITDKPTKKEPDPKPEEVVGDVLLVEGNYFTVRLPISGRAWDKRCITDSEMRSSVWSFAKDDAAIVGVSA